MHLKKRGPDNKSLTLKTHSIKLPSSPRQLSFNVKLSEYFFTAENISILKESFLTLHKIQIFFKDCSNFVLTLQTSRHFCERPKKTEWHKVTDFQTAQTLRLWI